jgi:hypothetical protein
MISPAVTSGSASASTAWARFSTGWPARRHSPLRRYLPGLLRLYARLCAAGGDDGIPVIYVFSHDSIGLGEDGPTHQPIEHVMSLRAMPQLTVIRPADGAETAQAWRAALENKSGPTALILSRQGLPQMDRSKYAAAEGLLRGAYVLSDAPNADTIIIATGSEVALALAAQQKLAAQGVAGARCFDAFLGTVRRARCRLPGIRLPGGDQPSCLELRRGSNLVGNGTSVCRVKQLVWNGMALPLPTKSSTRNWASRRMPWWMPSTAYEA